MGIVESVVDTPSESSPTDLWTSGDPLVLAPSSVLKKKTSPSKSSNSNKSSKANSDAVKQPANSTTRTHVIALCRAYNKFSLILLQCIAAKRQDNNVNVILSPIGLGVGLGTLCIGSDGTTRLEFRKALFLAEVEIEHRLPAFAAVYWDTTKTSNVQRQFFLQVSSKIFAQKEYQTTRMFRDTCTKFSLDNVKYIDFRKSVDTARNELNDYIKEKSKGCVTNAVPVGVIDSDTRLLLVCTSTIRANWAIGFRPSRTYAAEFNVDQKEIIHVKMMNAVSVYRAGYNSKLEADVVEIPWRGQHVKMVILLPRKIDSLAMHRMEVKLTRSLLENLEGELHPELLDLHIPRIRYELGSNISDSIEKTGLGEMFNCSKANFNLMDGGKGIHVSKVFHYISLLVDEGVDEMNSIDSPQQSNAANMQIMPPASSAERIFKVNRPFFFLIRDYRTRALLVIGRVIRPTCAKSN